MRANNGTANTTTSATYDALGEPTFATDALGAVTRSDYDIRGRVTQTIANCLNLTGCPTSTAPADPNTQSVTTTYSYDALDRVISENVPLDLNKAQHTVTASVYDADGRVMKSIQNYVSGGPSDTSTNVTSTTAYDAAGNATLVTDPAGNQTSTNFDALNRPVDVKQQSGGATPTVVSDKQTSYDGAGNVVQTVVDPTGKNLITSYTFDAANRTKTKTEPPAVPGATDASGQATLTTYSYDKDGNVTETKVTNQAVAHPVGDTTVTYDALGRPQQKQENGGTNRADGSVQVLTTTYIRDTQLQSIEWDSATCLSAQTAYPTTGTAPNKWAPLLKVAFYVRRTAIHSPLFVTSMPCNPDPNLRCDDPVSLTGSGELGILDVYTTYLVNDIFVNVCTAGWRDRRRGRWCGRRWTWGRASPARWRATRWTASRWVTAWAWRRSPGRWPASSWGRWWRRAAAAWRCC